MNFGGIKTFHNRNYNICQVKIDTRYSYVQKNLQVYRYGRKSIFQMQCLVWVPFLLIYKQNIVMDNRQNICKLFVNYYFLKKLSGTVKIHFFHQQLVPYSANSISKHLIAQARKLGVILVIFFFSFLTSNQSHNVVH